MTHSALYRGELVHARHDRLAKRAFAYGVYIAALDLDELPELDRALWLFSHRGPNLFSFDDRDYAATLAPSARAGGGLRESLDDLRAANGLPTPYATRVVTNLRIAGYVFNPISFFLDYNASGTLTTAIAEVNNTYGGRFRYVLGPAQRLPGPGSPSLHSASGSTPDDQPASQSPGTRVGFRHVRELFVSPFLHGPATYDFWFDAPLDGDALSIEMHVHHQGARTFTARLTGNRTALSDRTLAAAALRYPLMTLQVIGLIHFEALRLRLAGVPYRRPGRDHRPITAPGSS